MVTFGRLARAAIRDVGRALSYPLHEVERVAKLIPQIPVGMTIDRSLDQVKELKQLYESDPRSSGCSIKPATSRESLGTPRPTPPGS